MVRTEFEVTIARVQQMEQHLDAVLEMRNNCPDTILWTEEIFEKVAILREYYENGQWLEDYDLDASGALPSNLKRGVLAQDTLYDLLCEIDDGCKR